MYGLAGGRSQNPTRGWSPGIWNNNYYPLHGIWHETWCTITLCQEATEFSCETRREGAILSTSTTFSCVREPWWRLWSNCLTRSQLQTCGWKRLVWRQATSPPVGGHGRFVLRWRQICHPGRFSVPGGSSRRAGQIWVLLIEIKGQEGNRKSCPVA